MTHVPVTRATPFFWRTLASRGDTTAVVDYDTGSILSYRDLCSRVRDVAARLRRLPRSLILVQASNDLGCIICYLAALDSGHTVFLSPLSARQPGSTCLIQAYRPEVVLLTSGAMPAGCEADYEAVGLLAGYLVLHRRRCTDAPPDRSVALLLSTSASTGSPKSVRLSAASVAASAAQVAEALRLTAADRALLSLPLSFVYGLSVLNSSLHAGSAVALIPGTFADRSFYQRIAATGVTSLACVSQIFEYMRQLRIDASLLPTVSRLTHSGSALDAQLFAWIYDHFGRRGASVYLMYGQTEACGRISVLEPDSLPARHRSAGRAMRGGEVSAAEDGEIIYRGPGVMLGYATCREDLLLGDVLAGTLRTGDLGYVDEHGYLYITGRMSRYCKIFGQRVSLDDVEAFVRAERPAAVVEKDGTIAIFFEGVVSEVPEVTLRIARQFQLPPDSISLRAVPELPRTLHGKIAYSTLLTAS